MLPFEEEAYAQGFLYPAGVDEAGRGPLAGPVVAAACILPKNISFPEICDSKLLSAKQREKIYHTLTNHPQVIWGIGVASVEEIDTVNIFQASLIAMQRAIQVLNPPPDFVWVDGQHLPKITCAAKAIVKGDFFCKSVAAASNLAKVWRDWLMIEMAKEWPQYGFQKHKGYSTTEHREALEKYGPCPYHRRSFAPCR